MNRIVEVQIKREDGKVECYVGVGIARVVRTQTPVEDVVPAYWPGVVYLHTHLKLDERLLEEGANGDG